MRSSKIYLIIVQFAEIFINYIKVFKICFVAILNTVFKQKNLDMLIFQLREYSRQFIIVKETMKINKNYQLDAGIVTDVLYACLPYNTQ